MVIEILLLLFGLVLLTKGSDYFVRAAGSITKKLGVSEFVIGLTLVALGTSIPELASSIIASMRGAPELVIGNVVGSNIANVALIVGITAVIVVIATKEEMLKRDGYVMLFATALFFLFMVNGVVSRIEAGILLVLYFAYMIFLLEIKHEKKEKQHFQHFIHYFFKFRYVKTLKKTLFRGKKKNKIHDEVKEIARVGLFKDFTIIAVSGVALVIGARFLINQALFFANLFNMSETLIGISLVALGTSLPELMVSITSARMGFGDIALGNIIGSNVANMLLIVGVSGLLAPLTVVKSVLLHSGPFMILTSILLLIFIRSGWKLDRIEGVTFLGMYIIFMSLLFLTA